MKKLIFILIGAMVWFSCRKNDLPENAQVKKDISQKFFSRPETPKANGVLFKFKEGTDRKAFKTPYKYHKYFGKIEGDADALMKELKANPAIELVEPNYAVTTQDFNDPFYVDNSLWGLNTSGANVAWNSGNVGNQEVIVAVLDEGNQYWHCDLHNNIFINPGEIPNNNKDDDNNGFVDDVNGWNFFNNAAVMYTGNDDHGTHVAGTIAAKGNNGIGVIGIAPKVKILPVKFLADFGYLEHAIMGIDYIIDLKRRHNLNIKVINNSWGGGGFIQVLLDAINRAKAADILFVCAAGNANTDNDTSPFYPAGYNQYADNVISVGAMAQDLTKGWFSCFGQNTVDLFAPGVDIWSALPASNHIDGSYGSYNGTSMATPHVSGAAALYFSINPDASYIQCKEAILSSVTQTVTFSTLCKSGGYLNVSSFTGNTSPIIPDATCGVPPPLDITPPTTGRLISVTPINRTSESVDLYAVWQPGTDAESGITETWFRLYTNGVFDYWWGLGDEGGLTSFTFTGQSIGLSYGIFDTYFQQKDKWGNWSDTSNHIVNDLNNTTPDDQAPTLNGTPTTSDITASSITFNHDAATDNVGVTSYTINWRAAGGTWLQRTSNNLSETLNNLSVNTTYEFYYTASDAVGNVSQPSGTISATTLDNQPPSTCEISSTLNATSQALQVTLSWNNTITGDCSISSTRLERRKGSGSFSTVALDPNSPYQDNVPTPGNWTYRLMLQSSSGQTFYSNEKTIKVNKK